MSKKVKEHKIESFLSFFLMVDLETFLTCNVTKE